MEFRLKNVTPQPRSSKATLAVGNAGTDARIQLANEVDQRRVFYVASGLVLASFSDSLYTTCSLGAADGPIALLQCSNAGNLLATVHRQSEGSEVIIWNTSELTPLRKTVIVEQAVDIDFSYDGKTLYSFNTESGGLDFSHPMRESAHLICFTANPAIFVTGGVHHLAFWSITGTDGSYKVQKLPFKLGPHAAHCCFVDIMGHQSKSTSTACIMLALASDGKMIEFQHGKVMPDRIVQTRVPQATAFKMPCDTLLVVAGSGGVVKVLDTERWSTVATLPPPPSFPKPAPRHGNASPRHRTDASAGATAIAADGPHTVLVQYANSSLCCWDLQDPTNAAAKWEVPGHSGAITMLCAPSKSISSRTAEQMYTTICADRHARVWQQPIQGSNTAQLLMTLRLERATAQAALTQGLSMGSSTSPVAAMSAVDQMLAIGEPSGSVSVYILPSPTRCKLDVNHDGPVSSLAWGSTSGAQVLASGGYDGRVHLHRIEGARITPLKTLQSESAVTCVAFVNFNGQCSLILAVGEESGACTFWVHYKHDFQMLHELRLQELVGCSESCAIVCAHGAACLDSVALLSQNSHIVLVETLSGHVVQRLRLQHSSLPTCLDSAGEIVACGHRDGSIRCDLGIPRIPSWMHWCFLALIMEAGTVTAKLLTPGNSSMLHQDSEAGRCYCSLLDIVRGEELAHLRSHCERVSGCLLDAHRLELMTSGCDGCTHIWDISAIKSCLQHGEVYSASMSQPKSSVQRPKSRPKSEPLQDLQNVMAARNDGDPELAPLPSHLFNPRQAMKLPSKRRVDAVTMSVPVLDSHVEGIRDTQPEGGGISCQDKCVSNEEEASWHPRFAWAEGGLALGWHTHGCSIASLRHSIAGHPAAELRREALQRERAHKEWQSNNMTLLEELRTELEARPVRRSSVYRKSMSQMEIRASIPDRVQLHRSRVLSPIRQSTTESVSTAYMSQCMRPFSVSLRRSFSAPPPEDSPQNIRQSNGAIASTPPPSARTVSGVNDSFTSLTLPSPTTLARDLHKVGSFMQATDQEVTTNTPVLGAPKASESPREDTVRSDVKRGFSWQNNGIFKDVPGMETSALVDQGCQSWDQNSQPLFGNSSSPDVLSLSECRPAPAPSLATVIRDRGAAGIEEVISSGLAAVPGSKWDQLSRSFEFEASRSSRNTCGDAALRNISTMLPQGQQQMNAASTFQVEEALLADRATSLSGVQQAVKHLCTGDMGRISSPADACTTESTTAPTLPDTSLLHPGAASHRFGPHVRASSSGSPPHRVAQQICKSPDLGESVPSSQSSYARRHIPRRPTHGRTNATCFHDDTLDTPLSSLVSGCSPVRVRPNAVSMLRQSVNDPVGQSPGSAELSSDRSQSAGAIPKPQISRRHGAPFSERPEVTTNNQNVVDGLPINPIHVDTAQRLGTSTQTSKNDAHNSCDPSQGEEHPFMDKFQGAAAEPVNQCCLPLFPEVTVQPSLVSEVLATPGSVDNYGASVTAAIDAAFSPALRMGVQEVIQLAVDNGWDYHALAFRQALATKVSQECERLATLATELRGERMPQIDDMTTKTQPGVCHMFGQLELLRSRVRGCD